VTAEVIAAVSTADPWDAAMLALDTYLTHCCDPVYGRLVWLEGPRSAVSWASSRIAAPARVREQGGVLTRRGGWCYRRR
jgi:hypothetical protein